MKKMMHLILFVIFANIYLNGYKLVAKNVPVKTVMIVTVMLIYQDNPFPKLHIEKNVKD